MGRRGTETKCQDCEAVLVGVGHFPAISSSQFLIFFFNFILIEISFFEKKNIGGKLSKRAESILKSNS